MKREEEEEEDGIKWGSYPLLFVCVRTSPGILPNTQNPSTKRHKLAGRHTCVHERQSTTFYLNLNRTYCVYLDIEKRQIATLSSSSSSSLLFFLLVISFVFGSPSLNNNERCVLFRVSEKDWDTLFFLFFFFSSHDVSHGHLKPSSG